MKLVEETININFDAVDVPFPTPMAVDRIEGTPFNIAFLSLHTDWKQCFDVVHRPTGIAVYRHRWHSTLVDFQTKEEAIEYVVNHLRKQCERSGFQIGQMLIDGTEQDPIYELVKEKILPPIINEGDANE